jgi:hypothetical protein
MNVMTQALKAAGVKTKTHQEILWNVVRDYPGRTARAYVDLTKQPESSVSSMLSQMVKRKMLNQVCVDMRTAAGLRRVAQYTIAIKEYELLPVSKVKRPPANSSALVNIERIPACFEVVEPSVDIEKLTVSQARTLYLKLHKLFGDLK